MKSHCGFIAIVGRPNVGKSTLLNAILHKKVSITSHKPQTTRHRLLGIKTEGDYQMVFVDTPGLQPKTPRELNKFMNQAAMSSLADVDVILFLVEATGWRKSDDWVLEKIKKMGIPIVLGINKIDLLENKELLLPFIKQYAAKFNEIPDAEGVLPREGFDQIIPFSAEKQVGLEELIEALRKYLPESPWYFPKDQTVDREEQFIVSEMIREKLMRYLKEELPYSLTVTLETFKKEDNILRVGALIWVEKDSQKAIVIGKGGSMLKKIGTLARESIEKYTGEKVFLEMWVKVKKGWADDEKLLKQLGYEKD